MKMQLTENEYAKIHYHFTFVYTCISTPIGDTEYSTQCTGIPVQYATKKKFYY